MGLSADPAASVETLYRTASRRILATLIRLLGDFELAEDALHDAFQAALEQWPIQGAPQNPQAWLISTGRVKAIDRLRQRPRTQVPLDTLVESPDEAAQELLDRPDTVLADDHRRLIFTCCRPDLPREARTALTLREVCGLTTEEIARAFLVSPPAIALRIVRAKARIREAHLPCEVPPPVWRRSFRWSISFSMKVTRQPGEARW